MGAGTETLKRTPLHDRHVAAGAKLVPFAGWEMPVQYGGGIRAEHMAVRERAGVFDVSHMGELETSGAGASELLQQLLSNDVDEDRRGRRPVLRAVQRAGRGARRPVHVPAGAGPLPDRHEREQPRVRSRLVRAPRRRPRRDGHGPDRRLRDARRPGSAGARAHPATGRRRAAEALHHQAPHGRRCARRARLRHGLHGRGRRRAADRARPRGDRLGRGDRGRRDPCRARRARHAAGRGLLPPLRQRPDRGPQPDRGRPRLVLQGGHRLHRRRGDPRRRASTARPRSSSRSPSPARASPARATRCSAAAS